MYDERMQYGGDEGVEDDGEVVSFNISTLETGKVVVERLNFRDGGLEGLVVEGGVLVCVYSGMRKAI